MSVAVMTHRTPPGMSRRVVPMPEMVKLSFDARADLVNALDALARAREVSRADVLRAAVREYVSVRSAREGSQS